MIRNVRRMMAGCIVLASLCLGCDRPSETANSQETQKRTEHGPAPSSRPTILTPPVELPAKPITVATQSLATMPRTAEAKPVQVDLTTFCNKEGESTPQMMARLKFREVSAKRDGFECGAGLEGGLTFSPTNPYPDGKVAEFGVILPGDRVVKLELADHTYVDGRIVTKEFGTIVMRTNYGETLGDLSRSYLMSEEQIAGIRATVVPTSTTKPAK